MMEEGRPAVPAPTSSDCENRNKRWELVIARSGTRGVPITTEDWGRH